MKYDTNSEQFKSAKQKVINKRDFLNNLMSYCVIIPILFFINWFTSSAYWWAVWPAFGWGIGLFFHGISAYGVLKLFDDNWEKREIEKELSKTQYDK
jgi:hypothetical protein